MSSANILTGTFTGLTDNNRRTNLRQKRAHRIRSCMFAASQPGRKIPLPEAFRKYSLPVSLRENRLNMLQPIQPYWIILVAKELIMDFPTVFCRYYNDYSTTTIATLPGLAIPENRPISTPLRRCCIFYSVGVTANILLAVINSPTLWPSMRRNRRRALAPSHQTQIATV